jgi:hypothetical protein
MRMVKIAAAQMGPVQKAESRQPGPTSRAKPEGWGSRPIITPGVSREGRWTALPCTGSYTTLAPRARSLAIGADRAASHELLVDAVGSLIHLAHLGLFSPYAAPTTSGGREPLSISLPRLMRSDDVAVLKHGVLAMQRLPRHPGEEPRGRRCRSACHARMGLAS